MSDEDETDQVSIEETDEVEVEEDEAQEEATEQQEEEQEPPEAQAEQEAQEAEEEEQEAQHEEQQAEEQEDQQEEEEEEQEATGVANDDSPIEEAEKPGLQPGDSVRLKGLQSDTSMNGRVGKIQRREHAEDGGRFLVELGTRGVARVREANLEKVEPTRRSERLAKAKPAPAKRSERTPKKADRVKAKAAPKGPKGPSKATPKVTAVKKGSIKAARAAKDKTSGAAAQAENTTGQLFVVGDYRIRSDPCLEVQDSSSKWRPCHIYENYKDHHIVIWYGGNEYEGLGGKPYRLKGISPEAIFKGQPGQLLDSDGERIPTRKRPMR